PWSDISWAKCRRRSEAFADLLPVSSTRAASPLNRVQCLSSVHPGCPPATAVACMSGAWAFHKSPTLGLRCVELIAVHPRCNLSQQEWLHCPAIHVFRFG